MTLSSKVKNEKGKHGRLELPYVYVLSMGPVCLLCQGAPTPTKMPDSDSPQQLQSLMK